MKAYSLCQEEAGAKFTCKQETLAPNKQWPMKEEIKFLYLHTQYGNQWITLAKYLDSKSDNDAKNHYYSLLKKHLNKIVNDDYTFESNLAILQGVYFTKYLHKYFNQVPKPKKDYLNTIVAVKKISIDCVNNYSRKIDMLYPSLSQKNMAIYLLTAGEEGFNSADYGEKPSKMLFVPVVPYGSKIADTDKIAFIHCWIQQLKHMDSV